MSALHQIVATPKVDSIVALSWIILLALILVAKAAVAWLRFRRAARLAGAAERLATSMRPAPHLPQTHANRAAPAPRADRVEQVAAAASSRGA